MKLSDITGHDNAKMRLTTMVQNGRLPHALLLSAPEGSGEMMLARALAQYIHCTGRQPSHSDSCGQCPACLLHQSLNHTDLHYIYPVLKKGTETTSDDWLPQWRDLLAKDPWMDFNTWQAMLGNPNGQPKIYVHDAENLRRKMALSARTSTLNIALIWMPERMEPATANKLLKLIEEPEDGSMFILVSNAPGEILPTIYSRCQRIELRRLSDLQAASALANGSNPTPDQLAAANIAEGNVTQARKILSKNKEQEKFLDLFTQLMRLAYARKVSELKIWSEKVADLGRDAEIRFLNYAQRLIRENFILNLQNPQLNYLTNPEQQFSARFHPFINERNVEQLIDELNLAASDIAANGNAKIILFDLAIKTIILLKQ